MRNVLSLLVVPSFYSPHLFVFVINSVRRQRDKELEELKEQLDR